MRHLKTTMIMVAALVLTVLLGLAGCGEDRGYRVRSDRDRYPERYERQGNDRHDDRGGNPGRDRGEHGDR